MHDTRNSAAASKTARRICANALAWLTSKKHAPLHMCYHAEFGRSVLKHVGISTVKPPGSLDPAILGWGVAYP